MDNFHRQVRNVSVTDGDTISGEILLGFGKVWERRDRKQKPRFRIFGIDTPETSRRGKWDNDLPPQVVKDVIAMGKKATERMRALIASAHRVFIHSPDWKEDSFGRIMAHVFIVDEDGVSQSVGDILLSENLAIAYTPGRRDPTVLLEANGFEPYVRP